MMVLFMENIIIVECMSTGINFIQDIVDRNYNPIELELKPIPGEAGKIHQRHKQQDIELINEDFEVIKEKDSYEETLEMVRQ